MIPGYIFAFLFYSFFGWCIDTAYRSLWGEEWSKYGYFRIPVSTSYGFGAIILIFLMGLIQDYNIVIRAVIYCISLTALEYIAFVFVEKTIGRKVWDYSDETQTLKLTSKFNYGGAISLTHSVFWIILAFVFEFFLYSPTKNVMTFFDQLLPEKFHPVVLMLFIGASFLAIADSVYRNRKVMVETVINQQSEFFVKNVNSFMSRIGLGKEHIEKFQKDLNEKIKNIFKK